MTADLPTWDQLTDLDKGAALLHLHKRESEGASYAVEHYPAEYFDHPALVALDRRAASAHAASMRRESDALDHAEYGRLYDLALDADDARSSAAVESFYTPAAGDADRYNELGEPTGYVHPSAG